MRQVSDTAPAAAAAEVYVQAAVCTQITHRPRHGFYELCLEAGRRALERVDPLKIDSFYVASMEPALAGVTGELAAALAAELGLMPKEVVGLRGTSSAGGIGCIPCYKDIASGLHRHSLLVSCEQMNPVHDGRPVSGDTKQRNREQIQSALRGVIDPGDRAYGLSMILIGDLLQSALSHYAALPWSTERETLRGITLEMCRRARYYPFAQFHGRTLTGEDYDRSPWVSPYYRRDDVVPVSTGACAVVFSDSPPDDPPNGRVVTLRGIGQGTQHPSLVRRFGPVTTSPSVRRALHGMLQRAHLRMEDLRRVDLAFPHDAFPSISRIILREAGFDHEEAVHGLRTGRFNPFGGLVKCGHPVGCSGELQLVRAYQALTHDAGLPESIRPERADTAFTVSVGAALTNIIAVYLEGRDRGSPPPDRRKGAGPSRDLPDDPIFASFERAMQSLDEGAGVVLATTRTSESELALVQQRDRKTLALAEDRPLVGSLVRVEPEAGMNHVTAVLEERLDADRLEAFGVIPPCASPSVSSQRQLGRYGARSG